MARILHIEDQDYFRDDMCLLLEDEGFEMLGARDGLEGLKKIEQERPDLILCDIAIPKMSGFELLQRLRSEKTDLSTIPFIFLTGLDDKQDIIKGTKLMPDDYLAKPVDYEILIAKINATLNKSNHLVANLNSNNKFVAALSKIQQGLFNIINIANTLKHRTAANTDQNTVQSYADQIITTGLDLSLVSSNALVEEQQIANLDAVLTKDIDLRKLIEGVTAEAKKQKEHKLRPIFVDVESGLPNVAIEPNCFTRTLDQIFRELLKVTPPKEQVVVRAQLEYDDDTVCVSLSSPSLSADQATGICSLPDIYNTLRIQRIDIRSKTSKNRSQINLLIPHMEVQS